MDDVSYALCSRLFIRFHCYHSINVKVTHYSAYLPLTSIGMFW